ncbi:C4-dicarboxylate ABC transporter [Streptosporangium jomthongense]|uniref:TRAP transporter substrate-binding protein DctP n=1 Tax=Marinobacter aromaticivorans TaxID=1494078 RepID=A0ABW2J057_9GAMM|nr:TRAP transporter substrate-binding protein DctP [Marinobacter aromaticivorans]GGE79410.1 C4-dicarboxylate ABC transporter [Streptosporangium jomthongense]
MKFPKNALVAILAVTSLAVSAVSYAKVKLTLADHATLSHYLSAEGTVYFMERAKELSNGELEWDHYPAQQLVKAGGVLEAVERGRIDAGLLITQYNSDRLPLNGVGGLPGMIEKTTDGSQAYWSLVKEEESSLRKEFTKHGIMPLGVFLLPPYQILLAKDPLQSVSDLRGLKVKTAGGAPNITMSNLGAVPVQLSAPDLYLAIERGTVDGTLFSLLSGLGYNLEEIIKSATSNANFSSLPLALIINKEKFDSLPSNIQQALVQAGEDTIRHITQWMDKEEIEAAEKFKAAGVEVYELAPEMQEEIAKSFEVARQDWVDRLSGRGLDPESVLDSFERAAQGR